MNRHMLRAIQLAKKGTGLTAPNPCVGAVIVKGGRVVAEGWHKGAGSDHAEIVAMKQLMKKAGIITRDIDPALFGNATLYVTLEPCFHEGKTPPCVRALEVANFKEIVVGMIDPFEKVNGKSFKYLKNSGLKVTLIKSKSDLAFDVRELNQPFIKHSTIGLPYVILKSGISLDGKIANVVGESKWITCEEARLDSRKERSLCDAVLVGSGTVLADDPELAPIGKFHKKKLLRVIVDPKLSLPLSKKVFRDENVLVFTTSLASQKNIDRFSKAGIPFRVFKNHKVLVKSGLKFLAKMGIQSVFVEGGSKFNGSLYDAFLKDNTLIDKVLFYVAPKIIGGENALSVVSGDGSLNLAKTPEFLSWESGFVGQDLKISARYNFY